ncbi:MAG: hypothetical protein DHS20C18_48630 [Saprospiraceae bacterium]|nr:MAG: hypothetical protein DHS20C18_48630 [Saprospiraceae bacterium]
MIDEDKIIAYVLDELDETERQVVAVAIEKDEQLQQIAEHYQKIKQGFRAKRVNNLAEQIAAYEDALSPTSPKPDEQPKKRKKNTRRNGFTGFLILAVLGLVVAFFYGKSNYSNTALAQKYFLMPADPSVAGNQDATTFASGIEAFFNNQNYEQAASLFSSIADSSDYAIQAQYFTAHADFLNHNYEKALTEFTQLSGQKDNYPPDQQQRIEWNTMISRLAKGEEISSLPSQWSESPQGQALNRDLRSVWRKVVR